MPKREPLNLRRTAALVKKDILELLKNRQALWPMIAMPMLLAVLLPMVLLFGPAQLAKESESDLGPLLEAISGALGSELETFEQLVVVALLGYLLAPLFLMIPITVATITASSSFVGERERRTLEGLLYTPLSSRELVLGKVVASWIPALAITWLAFLVYSVLVNALAWPIFERIFFPNAMWFAMMLGLVPAVSFLAILMIVAVSQRASSIQSAQGMTSFLVFPILGLLLSQASGAVLFDLSLVLISTLATWLVCILVLWLVADRFSRERIVTRL